MGQTPPAYDAALPRDRRWPRTALGTYDPPLAPDSRYHGAGGEARGLATRAQGGGRAGRWVCAQDERLMARPCGGSRDGAAGPARGGSARAHKPCGLESGRGHDQASEQQAAKPLLDPLTLRGRVVTADALHTQRETAQYLVEEKEAHYLLTVKDNQPTNQPTNPGRHRKPPPGGLSPLTTRRRIRPMGASRPDASG